jgi:hypothetical protein
MFWLRSDNKTVEEIDRKKWDELIQRNWHSKKRSFRLALLHANGDLLIVDGMRSVHVAGQQLNQVLGDKKNGSA